MCQSNFHSQRLEVFADSVNSLDRVASFTGRLAQATEALPYLPGSVSNYSLKRYSQL